MGEKRKIRCKKCGTIREEKVEVKERGVLYGRLRKSGQSTTSTTETILDPGICEKCGSNEYEYI